MTYKLNDLSTVLDSKPKLAVLANLLASMLRDGYKQSVLIELIYNYSDTHELDSEYEDMLDDIIAAMEGHCHSSYLLHPSKYSSNLNSQMLAM
ncbi:hypothetical protein DLH87_21205 [Vibrio parahaemolyticus]|nr:hypothetical protein [Vibrio parahaemolyticus]MBG0757624.1 hypothetical protein [Vibrio cidicii]EGR3166538.1 hypothetical protein [Vibrio parahaemolyticus]EGR3213177.1 hypothetical protein [Vibrio parahaemolyticus]EGR3468049.1 hypothetical protein [Vibrio parahaemolyticus]